jgi:hypothetical protein
METRETEQDHDSVSESRGRFLASIERLTGLLMDRLAQSPGGKLMDEKETRMLGSVVMRSFSIWEKALATGTKDQSSVQKLEKLRSLFLENIAREE